MHSSLTKNARKNIWRVNSPANAVKNSALAAHPSALFA